MTTRQVQCLFQHPAPSSLLSPPSSSHHHRHHQRHTRKWKAQTRGPLDTPAQIIRLVSGPYPHRWKHARFLVLAKSTLSLGDKNEAKHHPQMATHPSLLAFYYLTQVTTMSETFHQHHNYGIKSPDKI